MKKDAWIQAGLFTLSTASLWFLSGGPKLQWLGFLLGLTSQPLWFIVSWKAKQWATAALCFVYGFCHLRGLLNHW
jgi:hypothetical protein